tara:strand:- start:390 stop:557 length:168 start_codon:yes stop_codon:yes gene_type:complete
MGVATLFDTSGIITLPVMLYQKMSVYRFEESAVIAFILVFLSVSLFVMFNRTLGK